jgi:hypothetical protein
MCLLNSVAAASFYAEPCTSCSYYCCGMPLCYWCETLWFEVFTIPDCHAVYVGRCLPTLQDTSSDCITTQKNEDLIYITVKAWNLTLYYIFSHSVGFCPVLTKMLLGFAFLPVSSTCSSSDIRCNILCTVLMTACHMFWDDYHIIHILEMMYLLSTDPHIFRYAKFCSVICLI